ncbi:DNA ATP-dependent helicase [Ephemerocybe angulata]|uniref:Chromatin-remodeling ATPase INO80 n=1 Tax=Ephemerocybe angulata TaxID=980116 RepID=A0A8H6IIH7_9AGAR|nr:DNA ATP-dependent helicase [Tulosesus angulatus]
MSLSRILNNEPLPLAQPGASRQQQPWLDPADDHPRYRYDELPRPQPSSSAAHYDRSDWHDRDDPADWDPSQRRPDPSRMHSEYSEHPGSSDEHNGDPAAWRKKRKNTHDDSDYQPGSSKRKSKGKRRMSTTGPVDDADSGVSHPPKRSDPRAQPMDEDAARLASSDLEDCQDVWLAELGDYILETKKRQNQVAQYFWTSILERNAKTTVDLSHQYASKVSGIPTRAASPPPHPPYRNGGPNDPIHLNGNGVHDIARTHSSDAQDYGFSAEEVANDFERSILGDEVPTPTPPPPVTISKRKGKGKKRAVPDAEHHSGSEAERPTARKKKAPIGDAPAPTTTSSAAPPPTKKRRLEKEAISVADDVERSLMDADTAQAPSASAPVKAPKGKGKAKQIQQAEHLQREPSMDSLSAPPVKPRKKPGPKKKLGLAPEVVSEIAAASSAVLGGLPSAGPSYPPSVSGDATPNYSRASSPAPANMSTIYDLDEVIPPMRKAKKIDDGAMVKRIRTLEEAQKKVWMNIARREVAKVYKYHTSGYQTRMSQLERTAKSASIQARKPFTKTPKGNKDVQAKAKRLMREMLIFWKKNEKEEKEMRKREHKEALDRQRAEDEKREAARQARKLEFLISQTELYSHFVGNKLKTSELEEADEVQADETASVPPPAPSGADFDNVDKSILPEIDFDDEDQTNLRKHAAANAQEALNLARQRAQQFDTQAALERKTNEALKLAKAQAHVRDDADELGGPSGKAPLVDLDSDELNFQNPTSLSGPLTVAQPKLLMATLKEYQLKGLNWLATLYEQGINGILADEMGLGKTVQSISLLAYLAEKHDIWGPFLVVAPASTLHNWQQELTRFVPHLKALPYWGNVKDRTTLRKFWSKKEISYDQNAPFHVLITSYQLITQDQQYFQRVKWQYMILDEAQNIKNSSSVRWKTLLGFQCRNRLLLTGTPIQNSMQELWALLHFIMPSLFDSHDEFNEWFSKDIESAAENKGSRLNEHQLRRLHMILKPFMLRRVKRHVQNELSEKIEIDIFVDLSARQRALYTALIAKVSVQDLLEKASNMGDADSARSLMNLVMQFRKVCNHPELFERADVVAPFSFCEFGNSGPLAREGDFVILPYSTKNPIEYEIPQLLYHDAGLFDVPCDNLWLPQKSSEVKKELSIWSTDWVEKSLWTDHSGFSFLKFVDTTPKEAHNIHIAPLMKRQLMAWDKERRLSEAAPYLDDEFVLAAAHNSFEIVTSTPLDLFDSADGQPLLAEISSTSWTKSVLSKAEMKWYIPSVVAPPIAAYCVDRTFNDRQSNLLEAPIESLAIYGAPDYLLDSDDACKQYDLLLPQVPPAGLVNTSPADQLPAPPMHVPEAKRLIYDSAKLARLDSLLQELKAGDHRVLVYFQMTRMMDLMEEYLIYRQYKYLRLDGSSKLEDRRDMVIDWQTRPDIFVFLLSTRAGGLGINLTAADTVVFYDHDWNPSNDAQAMDRAHRLGQTRQVTVYRLITKGTIDERIIQLARVKKDVQDIVVGNKTLTDMAKPREIVQLLLNDEQIASLDKSGSLAAAESKNIKGKQPAGKKDNSGMGDMWDEEGDDFFKAGAAGPGNEDKGDEDAGNGAAAGPQKRKRKSKANWCPQRPEEEGCCD